MVIATDPDPTRLLRCSQSIRFAHGLGPARNDGFALSLRYPQGIKERQRRGNLTGLRHCEERQ